MEFKWHGKGNTHEGVLSIDGKEITNCQKFTLEVNAVKSQTKLTMELFLVDSDIVQTFTENMDSDIKDKD